MGEHHIHLDWSLDGAPFTYDTYPRNHRVTFKDGVTVTLSAASAFRGDAAQPDPEDLLVASLSSCHMLSFLAIAAKKRVTVRAYRDHAVGFLENDGGRPGRFWVSRVILRPEVSFEGAPDAETVSHIHHLAHDACFIANSVRTDVRVEPVPQAY